MGKERTISIDIPCCYCFKIIKANTILWQSKHGDFVHTDCPKKRTFKGINNQRSKELE